MITRFFIPLLFTFLALILVFTWFKSTKQVSPEQEGSAFLIALQSGDLTRVVAHFGDNTCNCPAHYGWGAFLAYQPGQEPNLAFLLNHPFDLGTPSASKIESSPQAKQVTPIESPEDYIVDIPLTFNRNRYSPYFLPWPLAYGKNISQIELANFISHPESEADKNFTLRLRPGLKPGAIKFDTSTISPNAIGEFKFLKPKKNSELITPPQDAGNIIMPDGKNMPSETLAAALPRLQSTVIRLHVVRRGQLRPWTIFHFTFIKSVLDENAGAKQITL